MTRNEIDQLFVQNVQVLNTLSLASGSMVKALIQELENNGPCYIRLHNAVTGGHCVDFNVVEGSGGLVKDMAEALGLGLQAGTIEVPDA